MMEREARLASLEFLQPIVVIAQETAARNRHPLRTYSDAIPFLKDPLQQPDSAALAEIAIKELERAQLGQGSMSPEALRALVIAALGSQVIEE